MAKHELFFDGVSLTGYGQVTQTLEGRKDRRFLDFNLENGNISRIQIGMALKGIFWKRPVERILIVTRNQARIELLRKKCGDGWDGYVAKLRDYAKRNSVTLAESETPVADEA